eukprot:13048053-Ditylum_brightwellii.AAC.1
METIEHLLTYCDSHNLSFDTLVSEKSENIIRITKFDIWLENVLTYSQKPLAFRIAMTLKAMTEKTDQEEKGTEMNPRKCPKLVVPD